MASQTPEAQQIFGATYDPPEHLWLAVHFGRSEKAQAAGLEFLTRSISIRWAAISRRTRGSADGEEAIAKWGAEREGSYNYLKTIKQPALVVTAQGPIVYTINSFILQQNVPTLS